MREITFDNGNRALVVVKDPGADSSIGRSQRSIELKPPSSGRARPTVISSMIREIVPFAH
jgi:hypothetical protein